jgi:hypothetical protein
MPFSVVLVLLHAAVFMHRGYCGTERINELHVHMNTPRGIFALKVMLK